MVEDLVQIAENPDAADHKAGCERAFTMLDRHMNCVIKIQLKGKAESSSRDTPIEIGNLKENMLRPYGQNEDNKLEFS